MKQPFFRDDQKGRKEYINKIDKHKYGIYKKQQMFGI